MEQPVKPPTPAPASAETLEQRLAGADAWEAIDGVLQIGTRDEDGFHSVHTGDIFDVLHGLLRRLQSTEQELANLNNLCARRPALDQATLFDNVAKAIRVAGEKTDECVRLERRAEAAEQKVRDLEAEVAELTRAIE